MNCKNCKTPMERVFCFGEDGKSSQILRCPNCGAQTSARDIAYDDNGNLILAGKKCSKKKVKKRKKGE